MRNGKVAIVTGSSRGIGRGVALALAKAGYDIAVHHSDSLESAKETLRLIDEIGNGVKTTLVQGDIGDIDTAEKIVAKTAQDLGRVDVMVANAGITRMEKVRDLTPEIMDYLYNVDFRGTLLCAKAAARYMVDHQIKGSIILNTSIRSVAPHSSDLVYGALKAGLNRAIRSMAIDLGRYGIRVNGYAPGVTNVRCPDPEDEKQDGFYHYSWRYIPLRRNGYAQDMGGPVVFLAGDDSAYITGQVLHVDGGLSAIGGPEHVWDLTDAIDIKDLIGEYGTLEYAGTPTGKKIRYLKTKPSFDK